MKGIDKYNKQLCDILQSLQDQINNIESGIGGIGDIGVMYLKNNIIPTPISSINERAVVEGNYQAGLLQNFIKDPGTNSLKYIGNGGRFHVIVTFNFFSGANDVCGFYIGHNTNDSTPLDPNGDRISESEIYATGKNYTKPDSSAIQTVLDLNTNDRLFFITQNKSATDDILVEFMKYTVTPIYKTI